jgi:signal transduction histidine kinase
VRARAILRNVIRPRSIRRQLIIGVAGVHMILMISFVFDLVERQEAFLLERARSRTLHQAGVLASGAVPQFITRDNAGLQEILRAIAQDATVRSAMVTDEKGLVRSDSARYLGGRKLEDPRSLSVLRGETRARIIHEGATTLWAAAPILSDNSLLGWAWIEGDLAADSQQMNAVNRTGLIYILIAVISGALFAVVLATGITRQLRLLLAGTKRLAEDRLDQPVPVIADNDVGVVARAFNDAIRRLAAEREQLVQTRNRLEAEVRDRRRAEAQLTAANRAITAANESLREFAHAASHDLQEPLRGVSSFAELLQRRYKGKLDSDADEFIDFIHESAGRMQHLLKGLLDYSRAGATSDQQMQAVDADAALRSALMNLSAAIEESGALVEASELPLVHAHEVAIVQLFQNLIGNAIKYASDEPPRIRIAARTEGRECIFSVQDNGMGIGAEYHERIFRIFRRAHGDSYPGAGVGLAICSKIVERYAGRIWVESEPGKGSTFYFTLPADDAPAGAGGGPQRLSMAAGCGAA